MTSIEQLGMAVKQFAGLTEDEFNLSLPYWEEKSYNKGEYYNEHRSVCKWLGFISGGIFRSYIIDGKTGEEKNVFIYSQQQFIATFKSFIHQIPCDYHTQAMTDAAMLRIRIDHLLQLYQQSHAWERFGRLLAQAAFTIAMEKTEGFLFKTPEERYLELIEQHPDIFNQVPLYHISSYLGIQGPSLSRIRKRISGR